MGTEKFDEMTIIKLTEGEKKSYPKKKNKKKTLQVIQPKNKQLMKKRLKQKNRMRERVVNVTEA